MMPSAGPSTANYELTWDNVAYWRVVGGLERWNADTLRTVWSPPEKEAGRDLPGFLRQTSPTLSACSSKIWQQLQESIENTLRTHPEFAEKLQAAMRDLMSSCRRLPWSKRTSKRRAVSYQRIIPIPAPFAIRRSSSSPGGPDLKADVIDYLSSISAGFVDDPDAICEGSQLYAATRPRWPIAPRVGREPR